MDKALLLFLHLSSTRLKYNGSLASRRNGWDEHQCNNCACTAETRRRELTRKEPAEPLLNPEKLLPTVGVPSDIQSPFVGFSPPFFLFYFLK